LPAFFVGAFPLPASFSTGATTLSAATATGVYKPCLLCCSTFLRAPDSTSCLKRILAIEPTILYLSTTWGREMCFPILGIP